MTRSELTRALADKFPTCLFKDIELYVKHVFSELSDQLAEGGRIEIRGFGSFSTRYQAERIARNPKTGEPLHTEAKYNPYFKPGQALREQVNQMNTEEKSHHENA